MNENEYRFQKIIADVTYEWANASAKFAPFNSAHEGFAILNEEVDELWDEVKLKQGTRATEDLRAEAIQVAAMAIRFIYDVCDGKEKV
jgi:hypothetical protein